MPDDEILGPVPVGEAGAAQFRTMCEIMGYGVADVVEALGANRRTVSRWFGKEGPSPSAAQWVQAEWDDFMSLVVAAVEGAYAADDAQDAAGGQLDVVRVGRFRSEEAARAQVGVSRDRQNAQVRAIVVALEAAGFPVRVNYLD